MFSDDEDPTTNIINHLDCSTFVKKKAYNSKKHGIFFHLL
jgi:hypothetical protein